MLKIAIESDFWDFYDHAFYPRYRADIVWERKSRTSMSKREQFRLFENHGLKVPIYGTVREVYRRVKAEYDFEGELFNKAINLFSLVVYLDEYAHRGLGKVCVPIKVALEQYPDKFCTEFIQTTPSPHAVSYRYLQVGHKAFWLKYTGYDSWMSNHARKVDIEYLCPSRHILHLDIRCPMFAIDFIPGRVLYAIDLNTAPGLRDTGIPLSPKDIYDLVERWFGEKNVASKKEEKVCVR